MRNIVLMGDSITDADRRRDPEALGFGYARLIARECPADVRVVNRGISGDRAVNLRRRWDEDALAEKPWLLSVYVGINDVWRRFDSGDPTSAADFKLVYAELLSRSRDAGVERFALVEPFLLPVDPGQEGWLEDLHEKQEVVRALAGASDTVLVPLQEPLAALAGRLGPTEVASDGVHPSESGTRAIAAAWLTALRAAGWI